MQQPYVEFRSRGWSTIDDTSLIVRRGPAQFSLSASLADVRGTVFGTQLQALIDSSLRSRWGDPFVTDPAVLVYERCLPVIKILAPRTELQDLRLGAFLHSPTWQLRFVKGDEEGGVVVLGQDKCTFTSNFAVAPMATAELPDNCRDLPQFQAQDLLIELQECKKGVDSVQGRVRTADGAQMWFKPRLEAREPDFERELVLLEKIKSAGLALRLKVPELYGIAVSGESTVGFLMTLIVSPEEGQHLQSAHFHDKLALHAKWEDQISTTVRELHAHGIVWGDVNPMNVAIDEQLDAWVIDFGGSNNVQFVDDALRETEEGDWQGVRRLFRDWLPRQAEQCETERGECE